VSSWWVQHGWDKNMIDILPDTGFISGDDAACWVYFTNSNMAWVDWLVANPDSSPRAVLKASKAVLNSCVKLAKENNYHFVLSATKCKGLVKLYNKIGFQTTDTDMSHFVYSGEL